jgi:hypothetical protein
MFLEACSNYSVSEGNRGEILRVFDYSHSNIHGHISKQRLAEVDAREWKVFTRIRQTRVADWDG